MNVLQVNLGLITNEDKKLPINKVKYELGVAFRKNGMGDFKYRLAISDTEPTLVLRLETDLGIKQLKSIFKSLADKYMQDCIAIKLGEVGYLIYSSNPKNDWGEYKEEYFINY